LLIVPLVAGMVEADDALYTLSPTARVIWKHLDGKKTLQDIIDLLSQAYDASYEEIKEDVLGFASEMVYHSIITIVNS
jgi:hydroxylamine reductase (hybrid-cluster protein)